MSGIDDVLGLPARSVFVPPNQAVGSAKKLRVAMAHMASAIAEKLMRRLTV